MEHIHVMFSSLLKRKQLVIFMIIQLVISYWMFNNAFIRIDTISLQEKAVLSKSSIKLDTTMHLFVSDGDDSQWFLTKFKLLEDYIKTIPGVRGYGSYVSTTVIPEKFSNEKLYVVRNKELYKGTRGEEYTNSSVILYFDKDVYNYSKLSNYKGRLFEVSDFIKNDTDFIPVLVGYNYKDIFNLGDTFESHYNENLIIKYKVIGILDKGCKWLSGNDYIFSPVLSLDNYLISPFIPSIRQGKPIDTAVRLDKTFIELESKNDYNNVSKLIEVEGKKLGINPTIRSVRNDLNEYKENNKIGIRYSLFVGVFFLILTVIGVVSVTISSINSRKIEIGIRMATGFSKKDISIIIAIELFSLISLSAVVGTSISYIIELSNKSSVRLSTFNYELYAKIFILDIVITSISIMVPLLKISKMQLRELIGGRN